MIRLALVGGLSAAAQYASALSRLRGACFVAVVDADADRVGRAARLLRAPHTAASLAELLAQHADAFDAVLLHAAQEASPTECRRAADAGKHLLIEPPLASSVAVADDVIDACRVAGVRLMVGHASRFLPAVQTVKASLDSGNLGVPGLLRIHRWESRATDQGDVSRRQENVEHVSNVLDSSRNTGTLETCPTKSSEPHRVLRDIDLANWMFGRPPTEIYAVARNVSQPAPSEPDYVQIHLGFPDGGMACIDHSATLPRGEGYFSLTLIGSTGAAYADDHHNVQLLFGGGDPTALKTGPGGRHLLAQLQEFVNAIEAGREPSVTGADGRLAVQVAVAAAASIAAAQTARLTGGHYELV